MYIIAIRDKEDKTFEMATSGHDVLKWISHFEADSNVVRFKVIFSGGILANEEALGLSYCKKFNNELFPKEGENVG